MAVGRSLLDTSVVARLRLPSVAAVVEPLGAAGLLATCAVVELEVVHSARGPAELRRARTLRDAAYHWLETSDPDLRRALEVQQQLADAGRHRAVPLPDLVIAAVAERHRVRLLHYDADFDLVAQTTGQPCTWVVPRGSVS